MEYIEEQNALYKKEYDDCDEDYHDGYEEEEKYIQLDSEDIETLKEEIINYVLSLSEEVKKLLIDRNIADLCERECEEE